MPRMVVLTDSETASGFRIAGVEVREADAETAISELVALIGSDDIGLIAVDEGLVPDPVRATERAMRGRNLPVLLTIPSLGAAFGGGADPLQYMKDLVRSAIGFDIKLE